MRFRLLVSFIIMIAVGLCLGSVSSARAAASAELSVAEFGTLPVAHQGRIKPLSVFAREQLEEFSGESRWGKKPATQWLAALLFTPEQMEAIPMLRIASQTVRGFLSLPPQPNDRYSLRSVRAAMRGHLNEVLEAVVAKERLLPLTPFQEQLAATYARLQHLQQLQDSLSMMLPLPEAVQKTAAGLGYSKTITVTELQKQRKSLENRADAASLNAALAQIEERGQMSRVLAVIPSSWQGDGDWYSPWALRVNSKASPQMLAYQKRWAEMAQAYRSQNAPQWQQALAAAQREALSLGGSHYTPLQLWLEEWYYRLSFLSLAIVGYLAFVVWGVIFTTPLHRKLQLLPLFLGITCHGLALVVRMMVLHRPPVSNLYESVLFVSLLLALIGWRMGGILRLSAAGLAALLLLLSQSLLAGQEQLPVVMAVLNTDFWLGTHVICITSGYAAAIITSLMAHYRLWQGKIQGNASHTLSLLALVSLLLTAVGTLLGGIWADQSWGRFWGWDPKENGALLIVLWLIWLLHGRVAKQLSETHYLAGLAYLNVVVALAWFGVNLLSVGLHSYGFTKGTATGLLSFIGLETALIAGLWWRKQRREKQCLLSTCETSS
jgi:ABC-type transport system involved in cytochrome c biogenesis permease subunit